MLECKDVLLVLLLGSTLQLSLLRMALAVIVFHPVLIASGLELMTVILVLMDFI
jgi:hypothetical protein